MANGDKYQGPHSVTGEVTGTGASIAISLDFKPIAVQLFNATTPASLFWLFGMGDDKGFKFGGAGAGGTFTGAALAAHGHNVITSSDEVIAVTAGTGVSAALTSAPLGAVSNVYITAGGVTGAAVQVPSGAVANSKEVSVNYTTGVLQFLVADAVTQAKVSYARAAVSNTSAGTPAGTIAGGGAAGGTFIATGGITAGSSGFQIGTDADLNIVANTIYWKAFRSYR